MHISITAHTDCVDEGRRLLNALETLLSAGVPVGYNVIRTDGPAPAGTGEQPALLPADAIGAGIAPHPLAVVETTLSPAPEAGEAPAGDTVVKRRASRKPKAEAEAAPAEPVQVEMFGPPAELAPEPEPEAAAPEAAAPEAADADEVEVTVEFLRNRVNYLCSLTNSNHAMAVVKRSGHDKIVNIPEAKWSTFSRIVESEVAKAEAARDAGVE